MSDSDETAKTPDYRELNVRRNLFQRIKDRLWGYDFFISYHWASGGSYAVKLAQQLRAKSYEVFLDRADYASGDDWKEVGAIALHNTQRLVLIATREAVTTSKPVQREIELFTVRNRQVISIVFGDQFSDLDRANYPTLERMPDSRLYIDDGKENLAIGPSDKIVAELIRTQNVMRRRNLRALLTLIPVLAVAVFAAFATLSWARALVSAKAAEAANAQAQIEKAGAIQARNDALLSSEETKHALTTNLQMFTAPTKLAGRIAAAVTRRDSREVSDMFLQLTSSPTPIASSTDIANATSELGKAIAKWNSNEEQSWDTNEEQTSEEVRQKVILLAEAVKNAWESQFPRTRTAGLNRAKEIARQILVKPTYDHALEVTLAIANGSKDQDKIDEFESLYYSELIFLETREVASRMIVFRCTLRGNPDYEKYRLKDVVDQLKVVCDKALSEAQ